MTTLWRSRGWWPTQWILMGILVAHQGEVSFADEIVPIDQLVAHPSSFANHLVSFRGTVASQEWYGPPLQYPNP